MRRTFTTIVAVSAVTLSLSAQTVRRVPVWCSCPPASSMATRCTTAGRTRERRAHRRRGPEATVAAAGREGHRAARTTLMPGLDRRAFTRPAAPLQRGRGTIRCRTKSLGARVARATNHLRATLAGRLHHHPRSRHRGGRLRRCRAETGRRSGDRAGAAHPRVDARHRRDRQLPAEIRPMAVPQGAEEADGVDRSSAWSATRSATERTGSRYTPTIAGVRYRDPGPPSPWRSCG